MKRDRMGGESKLDLSSLESFPSLIKSHIVNYFGIYRLEVLTLEINKCPRIVLQRTIICIIYFHH